MNILELLESIEWDGMSEMDCCPSCRIGPEEKPNKEHYEHCKLKAAIDALKSGRLVVVDAETAKLVKWAKNTLPVATPFKKEQRE